MPALTYWDYLHLEPLLSAQGGAGGEAPSPDELHFIVVHQAFELWFKLVLSQLRLARDHLAAAHIPEERVPFVVHHLGRVNEILKLLVEQFRVMETLPPQDFLAFRDKLVPASGFQSFQLREIEILLGLEEQDRVAYGGLDAVAHMQAMTRDTSSGQAVWARLLAVREEVSLRSALHNWLYRTPIHGSVPGEAHFEGQGAGEQGAGGQGSGESDEAVVDGFCNDYYQLAEGWQRRSVDSLVASLGEGSRAAVTARVEAGLGQLKAFLLPDDPRTRRVHAALVFIESYRELPLLAWPRLLLDTVVEAEEQLLLFRNRHARMVERIIGRRVGTGGSTGVEYLDQTSRYRIFPELWSVRTALLPREVLPAVRFPERYGFRG